MSEETETETETEAEIEIKTETEAEIEAVEINPVIWDAKRVRIPMKFRESTLEAIEYLDKNMFPNRTDFIERIVENYLIKKGFLKKDPHPKNHVTMGAKSRMVVVWNKKRAFINFYLRKSTLEAIGCLDKNMFPNRTNFIERIIENYLVKKGHLAKQIIKTA